MDLVGVKIITELGPAFRLGDCICLLKGGRVRPSLLHKKGYLRHLERKPTGDPQIVTPLPANQEVGDLNASNEC